MANGETVKCNKCEFVNFNLNFVYFPWSGPLHHKPHKCDSAALDRIQQNASVDPSFPLTQNEFSRLKLIAQSIEKEL